MRPPVTSKHKLKIKRPIKNIKTQISVPRKDRVERPRINNRGSRTVVVTHKEFALAVTSEPGFAVLSPSQHTPGLDINPANSILFPWLSSVAQNYERYRFKSLALLAKPSCPTTTAGKWVISIDYDYDDPVPTDKTQMLNSRGSVSFSAFEDGAVIADVKGLHNDQPWKYTQHNSQRGSGYVEPRSVYGGFFAIASDNIPAGYTLDVWMAYTVEFDLEQLPVNSSINGQFDPVGTSLAALTSYMPPIQDVPNLPLSTIQLAPIPGAGFTTAPSHGVDVAKLDPKKRITVSTTINNTTQTPAQIVPDLKLDLGCYDDKGVWKTPVIVNTAFTSTVAGAKAASYTTWGNAAADAVAFISVAVSELQRLGIRYVVPYLYKAGGFAAATTLSKYGIKVEL